MSGVDIELTFSKYSCFFFLMLELKKKRIEIFFFKFISVQIFSDLSLRRWFVFLQVNVFPRDTRKRLYFLILWNKKL